MRTPISDGRSWHTFFKANLERWDLTIVNFVQQYPLFSSFLVTKIFKWHFLSKQYEQYHHISQYHSLGSYTRYLIVTRILPTRVPPLLLFFNFFILYSYLAYMSYLCEDVKSWNCSHVGAGNWTKGLWKSSSALNHWANVPLLIIIAHAF